jgi:hypothetical protein
MSWSCELLDDEPEKTTGRKPTPVTTFASADPRAASASTVRPITAGPVALGVF